MKYLILILLLTGCNVDHNFDDIDLNLTVDVSQIRVACEESLVNTTFANEKEYTATLGQCILDEADLLGINIEDIEDEEIKELIEGLE
jgi:hypothetical protein